MAEVLLQRSSLIISDFIKGIHSGLHGRMRLARQGQDIAILAITHAELCHGKNLILVIHNTRHFERIPSLKLEDWIDG